MAIGSGSAWRLYASFSGKNKDLLKANNGAVLSAVVENRSATKQYLQLFDAIAAPSANDIPLISVPLPASGGGFVLDQDLWGLEGHGFQRGIAYGVSTSVETYVAGSTDVTVQIWYW